ncbi:MAG: GDP-mannose 4,6-dehydratase [Gemmatimonadetes bacterium]|nr:GDP-mannose 4,6-dehydratase [Gemmatimonadota bacterium]
MSRRALVTGAGGFVGQYVARQLLADGWEVTGASAAPPVAGGALAGDARAAVRWVLGDLRADGAIMRLLDAERPDAILHLAGIAHVVSAQEDPALAFEVNTGLGAHLLAHLRVRRAAGTMDPVVLVVGSAEQYGRQDPVMLPLREDTPLLPLTVYAATKAAQEVIALEAHRGGGVRVVCTRSFNHAGPGQAPGFLLPSLAAKARALRASGGRELLLGNTTPIRDWLHVEDVARAYVALLASGVPGTVYNVASGTGRDVATIARRMLALAGVEATLGTDPALVRAVDVPALVGDASRLMSATGWAPVHSFDDLLADVLDAAP